MELLVSTSGRRNGGIEGGSSQKGILPLNRAGMFVYLLGFEFGSD